MVMRPVVASSPMGKAQKTVNRPLTTFHSAQGGKSIKKTPREFHGALRIIFLLFAYRPEEKPDGLEQVPRVACVLPPAHECRC